MALILNVKRYRYLPLESLIQFFILCVVVTLAQVCQHELAKKKHEKNETIRGNCIFIAAALYT